MTKSDNSLHNGYHCQINLPNCSFKVQALIFDLDGTLIDSMADIVISVEKMCAKLGTTAPEKQQIANLVGKGSKHLVAKVCKLLDMEEQTAQAEQIFINQYLENGSQFSVLLPMAKQFLATSAKYNIPTVLATNKPRQVTVPLLAKLGIDRYFSAVYAGDDFAKPKPNPAMLLAAVANLKLSAEQCLMIGDSNNDIKAANSANIKVIAIEGGYNHGKALATTKASAIVSDLAQLYAAVSYLPQN